MTEDQRGPREFEDGLSSGSGAEESGGTQPPGSKMLRELLEKAPADRPEYAEDLSILHSLIEYGGPHNCASSMWFRFLKDHYPAEYEALKAEHLGEGKSLQEGFQRGRGFAREEIEHLDVNEDLVFCTESETGYYEWFMHEADVLLWALGRAWEEGDLALDGLREYWQPYRRHWPALYEARLKEWYEDLWPSLSGNSETPVTNAFEHEADVLGLPGVGYFGDYDASIEDLCAAMAGSYKIVVKENSSDYDFGLSPRQVIELFEETLTNLSSITSSLARSGEYIVFCNQPYGEAADGYWGEEGELYSGEDGEYQSFWHEADVLLLAVAGEVERGELTPARARKLLEPYREVLSVIYTGEQRMIYDPRREWWSRPESFPGRDDVRRNRPASAIFWYEADDLGIPGVGLTTWATPHPFFEVRDAEALQTLREAVAGKYEVVVKEDTYKYLPGDVEWALETIQEAREE